MLGLSESCQLVRCPSRLGDADSGQEVVRLKTGDGIPERAKHAMGGGSDIADRLYARTQWSHHDGKALDVGARPEPNPSDAAAKYEVGERYFFYRHQFIAMLFISCSADIHRFLCIV